MPCRFLSRPWCSLPAEPCSDCCVHCWCSPCAICQEVRHSAALASCGNSSEQLSQWFAASCKLHRLSGVWNDRQLQQLPDAAIVLPEMIDSLTPSDGSLPQYNGSQACEGVSHLDLLPLHSLQSKGYKQRTHAHSAKHAMCVQQTTPVCTHDCYGNASCTLIAPPHVRRPAISVWARKYVAIVACFKYISALHICLLFALKVCCCHCDCRHVSSRHELPGAPPNRP
jgi:hypothetical protein